MHNNVDIHLSFESDKFGEISLQINVDLCRNGIGSYEYWGQKCFDKGSWELDDYTITRVTPSSAQGEASLWCEENIEKIEEEALNQTD